MTNHSLMPFAAALSAEKQFGRIAVIPDIKCISPKEGDLLRGRDPVSVAADLVSWGAPVLSVVTEETNFGGSPRLLQTIAERANVPVLRKDFIRDAAGLRETVSLGASAVLLIAASVDEKTLTMLYEKALHVGLEPLVEIHTAAEMAFAQSLQPQLLGINNRNILDLELDNGNPDRTQRLAEGRPANSLLISESGILTAEDATQAVQAGADAILVGTALWQASDMASAYRMLQEAASCA